MSENGSTPAVTIRLFAYGSLLCAISLSNLLQRSAQLHPVQISGWRRVYNAPFEHGGRLYAFLNLTRDPGSTICGAYFEVTPAELDYFKEREAGSELVDVGDNIWAFVWPASSEHERLPVLRSYINFCEQAAVEIGIDDLGFNPADSTRIHDDSTHPLYP